MNWGGVSFWWSADDGAVPGAFRWNSTWTRRMERCVRVAKDRCVAFLNSNARAAALVRREFGDGDRNSRG